MAATEATWGATTNATMAATKKAAEATTWATTWSATRGATEATWGATTGTMAATAAAAEAATRGAEPEGGAWYTGVGDMAACAEALGVGRAGLECAEKAYRMWQGGNQWAAWPALAEFFREVAELPIDWDPWMSWVTLAERSGPRIVHPEFCIVSDRPEILLVDEDNRPHCDDGPFCRWRDGTALYSIHGVRVPWWVVEHPERITVERIHGESNTEVRRIMLERYGIERYMEGATLVDECMDEVGQVLRLLRRDVPDDEPIVMVRLVNSTPDSDGTRRIYLRRVPPDITATSTTSAAMVARNWTANISPDGRFEVQT